MQMYSEAKLKRTYDEPPLYVQCKCFCLLLDTCLHIRSESHCCYFSY